MKVVKVTVPHTEMMCLISIWPTMLSAVGGDFDDDTVFVDIFRLDQRKMNVKYVKAGVWDHHFDEKGDYVNQGISSYIGPFNHSLDLRIVITGDDLAGTSYSVVEQ